MEEEPKEPENKKYKKKTIIHPFNLQIIQENFPTKFPENGLEEITDVYQIIRVLGFGASATTVELRGKNSKKLAVKILPFNKLFAEELITLAKLNNLNKYTPIFNHNIGWTVCEYLPENWKNVITQDKLNKSYVRGFMESNKQGFFCFLLEMNEFSFRDNSIILEEHDVQCFAFFLLHGIATARNLLGYFKHRDIHPGNIMFNLVHPPKNITIQLSDKRYITVKNVKYLPKLIDFGEARFTLEGKKDDVKEQSWEAFVGGGREYGPRNDIFRIKQCIYFLYAMNIRKEINKELWEKSGVKFAKFTKSAEYKLAEKEERNEYKFLESLLDNDYFAPIVEKNAAKNIAHSCIICSNEAKFEYNNGGNSYKFCSKMCEENSNYSLLKHLIKF